MATRFTVDVDRQFHAWLPSAATRLGYLHPETVFAATDEGLEVSGGFLDEASARREVLHAVYRERILAETAPLRSRLVEGLLG